MTTPDRFEDRLLAELRAVVAATPAESAPAPARRRALVPRPRLAFGAAVAAAAAAALVVQSGGSRPDAAYAVDQRPDGMVTVEIRSLRDAAGLEQALRARGVPAEVDYADEAVCPAAGPPPQPLPAGAREEHGNVVRDAGGPVLIHKGTPPPAGAPRHAMLGQVRIAPDGSATFGIDPGRLGPGEKVWITTSGPTVSFVAMGVGRERPAAPPCPPGG